MSYALAMDSHVTLKSTSSSDDQVANLMKRADRHLDFTEASRSASSDWVASTSSGFEDPYSRIAGAQGHHIMSKDFDIVWLEADGGKSRERNLAKRMQAYQEAEEQMQLAEKYLSRASIPSIDLSILSISGDKMNKSQRDLKKGYSFLMSAARKLYASEKISPYNLWSLGSYLEKQHEAIRDNAPKKKFKKVQERIEYFTRQIVAIAQRGDSLFALMHAEKEEDDRRCTVKQFADGSRWMMSSSNRSDLERGVFRNGRNNIDPIIEWELKAKRDLKRGERLLLEAFKDERNPDLIEEAKRYFVDAAKTAFEALGTYPEMIKKMGQVLLGPYRNEHSRQRQLESLWHTIVKMVENGDKLSKSIPSAWQRDL